MIIIALVLLNMLIAIMGETFQRILEKATYVKILNLSLPQRNSTECDGVRRNLTVERTDVDVLA